ncbi:hypothetical protein NBC122_00780 [Chryseobacterium salivictor]|uniref:Uncharacterized protein n=1 Tax=Chryseobacterium salivictor TaxID=2547600 RepID=A0A4P6ZDU1_9FLAO|nr:hypothetical protein NBC122_00780 [Chryseobacterium salivictor]
MSGGWFKKVAQYIYCVASNCFSGKVLLNITMADSSIINITETNEFWKYSNGEE